MSEIRELTCIGCPMGCHLAVTMENGEAVSVTGNTCKIGENYGKKEVTDPRRTVTSSVRVKGGVLPVTSVKTQSDIPKNKIFDCMREIDKIILCAPVKIGDVVIKDVLGTGVDVVATRNVAAL